MTHGERGWPGADGVWVAPRALQRLAAGSVDSFEALISRQLGSFVTDHRSSWVRRLALPGGDAVIKTYAYPRWRDRLRGALRNTWLAPSRARREQQALLWMKEHGFAAPQVLAVFEARHLSFLTHAVLVTEAFGDGDLATLLPRLAPAARERCLTALASFVTRLHAAGFRDRNLDLRNLLARERAGLFEIAKIDSPRYRLVRLGDAPRDRLARADRMRLGNSLASLGLLLP